MNLQQFPGVWVDVFELSRYRGRRRRLFGPSQFVSVRSRSVDWGISIDSVILGPKAYVRLFQAGELDGRCVWLSPRKAVADVVEIRVGDEFDSLAILSCPPREGEPCYASYLAAHKQKPADFPRE